MLGSDGGTVARVPLGAGGRIRHRRGRQANRPRRDRETLSSSSESIDGSRARWQVRCRCSRSRSPSRSSLMSQRASGRSAPPCCSWRSRWRSRARSRAGAPPDCHRFGQVHSRPVGRGTVARNVVLFACASFPVRRCRPSRRASAPWIVAAAAGVVIVALVAFLPLVLLAEGPGGRRPAALRAPAGRPGSGLRTRRRRRAPVVPLLVARRGSSGPAGVHRGGMRALREPAAGACRLAAEIPRPPHDRVDRARRAQPERANRARAWARSDAPRRTERGGG